MHAHTDEMQNSITPIESRPAAVNRQMQIVNNYKHLRHNCHATMALICGRQWTRMRNQRGARTRTQAAPRHMCTERCGTEVPTLLSQIQ